MTLLLWFLPKVCPTELDRGLERYVCLCPQNAVSSNARVNITWPVLITISQNRIQLRHFLKDWANGMEVPTSRCVGLRHEQPRHMKGRGNSLRQRHLTHLTKLVFTMWQSQKLSRSCLSQASIWFKVNVRQGCNLPKYQHSLNPALKRLSQGLVGRTDRRRLTFLLLLSCCHGASTQ